MPLLLRVDLGLKDHSCNGDAFTVVGFFSIPKWCSNTSFKAALLKCSTWNHPVCGLCGRFDLLLSCSQPLLGQRSEFMDRFTSHLTPSRPMGPAFNTLMCAASSHRKWILWDDAVTVRDCKQPSWNTAGCVKDLESLKIPSFYCLLGVNMIGEECWWERDVLVSGDLYWSLLILACKILKVFPLLLSWQTSWQMFISWGNPIWPQQFRRMFGCSSPF